MLLLLSKTCVPAVALISVVWASLAFAVKPANAQKRRTVQVPKDIVQQLMKDEDLKESIQLRPDGSVENLVAEQIDLNGDGKPELKVQGINSGICGNANCPTWVFRKLGSHYQMLLDAGAIQQIRLQNAFTHGYRDIITSMHGSAWDSGETLYKFDGKRYQRVACFYRTYHYQDEHGKIRELKRPKISRVKCEPKQ